MTWDEMNYWQSGEWQVVQEKLDDLDIKKITYNPKREDLFNALDAIPFDKVRVVFLGQDPYPDSKHATGLAFDVPPTIKKLPPTCDNILTEYAEDLRVDKPTSGSLKNWSRQGVLLWNVIPSCKSGEPLSHNWLEWEFLTQEIVERLSDEGNKVFVNFGSIARTFNKQIDESINRIINLSHPSPRGQVTGRFPFKGAKPFTTVNTLLEELKQEKIDWRL